MDVRTVPASRRVPWASGDALSVTLAEHGIAYEHAPALGGLRKPKPGSRNTALRSGMFRAYADHMATPEFQAALSHLLSKAAQSPTVVMCAEAVPWRCHRNLLADAAVARGADVVHLLGPDSIKPHELSKLARVVAGVPTYPGEEPLF